MELPHCRCTILTKCSSMGKKNLCLDKPFGCGIPRQAKTSGTKVYMHRINYVVLNLDSGLISLGCWKTSKPLNYLQAITHSHKHWKWHYSLTVNDYIPSINPTLFSLHDCSSPAHCHLVIGWEGPWDLEMGDFFKCFEDCCCRNGSVVLAWEVFSLSVRPTLAEQPAGKHWAVPTCCTYLGLQIWG